MQVGLIGLGTVGAGTFHVLQRNQAEIRGRAGRGIAIAMVAARNAERAQAYQAIVGDGVPCTGDAQQLVNHPDIDIVVE
ncbi:homoserine dehydrogenase, partial [Escherichia coli]